MRRIQIHLDDDLDEALARQAFDRRISKAALIREYLREHVGGHGPARRDAADALIGAYEGSEDESSRVDDVVYRR